MPLSKPFHTPCAALFLFASIYVSSAAAQDKSDSKIENTEILAQCMIKEREARGPYVGAESEINSIFSGCAAEALAVKLDSIPDRNLGESEFINFMNANFDERTYIALEDRYCAVALDPCAR